VVTILFPYFERFWNKLPSNGMRIALFLATRLRYAVAGPVSLSYAAAGRPTQIHTDKRVPAASRAKKNCKYEEEAFHQQPPLYQAFIKNLNLLSVSFRVCLWQKFITCVCGNDIRSSTLNVKP
jgi:hypothetical protein